MLWLYESGTRQNVRRASAWLIYECVRLTSDSNQWWWDWQRGMGSFAFCIFYKWQCGQQALVLTSALHLPYFRMPFSRKKYLCGERGAQWANKMQPGWYATPLTASLKSLLQCYDHDSLLLMYDVNVSAVRCLSSQALACLCYSSSHSVAVFSPLSS